MSSLVLRTLFHASFVIATTGCEPEATQTKGTTGAGTSASSAQHVEAGASRVNDECAELKAAFRSKLASASLACETSADCTCSPGGIRPAGCGRVVDRRAAKALFGIYERVREQCGLDFLCGAQRCLVACEAGTCIGKREPDRIPPSPLQPK